MAEQLVIRLGDTGDTADWLLLDEQGNRIGHARRGPLGEAAVEAARRRVRVLVPGQAVLMLEAEVPTRNPQRLLQALPYALEERLSSDVEELHFAPGPRVEQRVTTAVVAHAQMRHWLEALAAAGLEADSLCPDFLGLPLPEDGLCLGLEADAVLIRHGRAKGCRVQPALAADVLRQIIAARGAAPPARALLLGETRGEPADRLCSLLEHAGLACERAEPTPLLPALAAQAARPELDLLQGAYRPRREETGRWRPWRLPAGLAAALALLVLGLQIADYILLKQRAETLLGEMNAVLQQGFPGARDTLIPRDDMESRLKAMRGAGEDGQGFLALLAPVGQALSRIPNARLNGLSYRGGELEISVHADDVQALDRLKTLLGEQGLAAEIRAANNRGERVEGRLSIRAGGAA